MPFPDAGELLARLAIVAIAFPVHEYAHAWVAYKRGDLTAYMQGRVTLDPRRHIDPLGALLLLFQGFGWARPVPIDPARLGRQGTFLVTVAGPLSNVALAVASALGVRALETLAATTGAPSGAGTVAYFLYVFATINIVLAVFNLLPLAPLDGWKVLLSLAPPATAWRLQQQESTSTLVLLAIAFVVPWVFRVSPLSYLFRPAVDGFWRVFGG